MSDRIQKLERRVENIERNTVNIPYNPQIIETPNASAKIIAAAIVFFAFVGLFCVGCIIGWHWGWLVAIAVVGVGAPLSIAEMTL